MYTASGGRTQGLPLSTIGEVRGAPILLPQNRRTPLRRRAHYPTVLMPLSAFQKRKERHLELGNSLKLSNGLKYAGRKIFKAVLQTNDFVRFINPKICQMGF
jgi:hypothetical protein